MGFRVDTVKDRIAELTKIACEVGPPGYGWLVVDVTPDAVSYELGRDYRAFNPVYLRPQSDWNLSIEELEAKLLVMGARYSSRGFDTISRLLELQRRGLPVALDWTMHTFCMESPADERRGSGNKEVFAAWRRILLTPGGPDVTYIYDDDDVLLSAAGPLHVALVRRTAPRDPANAPLACRPTARLRWVVPATTIPGCRQHRQRQPMRLRSPRRGWARSSGTTRPERTARACTGTARGSIVPAS
jgi:hypothetical protein